MPHSGRWKWTGSAISKAKTSSSSGIRPLVGTTVPKRSLARLLAAVPIWSSPWVVRQFSMPFAPIEGGVLDVDQSRSTAANDSAWHQRRRISNIEVAGIATVVLSVARSLAPSQEVRPWHGTFSSQSASWAPEYFSTQRQKPTPSTPFNVRIEPRTAWADVPTPAGGWMITNAWFPATGKVTTCLIRDDERWRRDFPMKAWVRWVSATPPHAPAAPPRSPGSSPWATSLTSRGEDHRWVICGLDYSSRWVGRDRLEDVEVGRTTSCSRHFVLCWRWYSALLLRLMPLHREQLRRPWRQLATLWEPPVRLCSTPLGLLPLLVLTRAGGGANHVPKITWSGPARGRLNSKSTCARFGRPGRLVGSPRFDAWAALLYGPVVP